MIAKASPANIGAALIVTVAILRLVVALSHDGYWGVDGGAYLLSAHAVLTGEQIADFPRPPFAPGWLLVPWVELFGPLNGLKVFSVLASLAILPGFTLLARRFLTPWQTVAAIGLLCGDWMLAEMFIAGDLPMIAFGFLLIALWGILELTATGRARGGVALALALPCIALTNQTTAGIAAVTLPPSTIGVWALNGARFSLAKRLAMWAAIGLALCMPILPWYTSVAPGSEYTRYPGPLITFWAWINAAYVIAAAATIISGLLLWKGNRELKAVAVFMLTLTPLTTVFSFDESIINILYRSQYVIMAPIYIGGVWLVARYGLHNERWRNTTRLVIAAFVPFFVFAFYYQTHVNKNLEMMVSPDTSAAIERIEQNGTVGTVVTNSYSMSLYVAALAKLPVAWSQIYSPPPKYIEQHQNTICLFGWRIDCDPIAAAHSLDAEYVLIERLWPVRGEGIANNVPGLGDVYRTVSEFADPNETDSNLPVMGEIWDVPNMQNPWEVTEERATWLTPMFERGTTILYKVDAHDHNDGA